MDNIKEGTVLVSKWGYSMILSTWVKVIKVSPKTLLVQEISSRMLTPEELAEKNLKPAYLQGYSIPLPKEIRKGNFEDRKPFRIYKRDENYFVGTPSDMSSQLSFKVWDGEPEFEDHCD